MEPADHIQVRLAMALNCTQRDVELEAIYPDGTHSFKMKLYMVVVRQRPDSTDPAYNDQEVPIVAGSSSNLLGAFQMPVPNPAAGVSSSSPFDKQWEPYQVRFSFSSEVTPPTSESIWPLKDTCGQPFKLRFGSSSLICEWKRDAEATGSIEDNPWPDPEPEVKLAYDPCVGCARDVRVV